MCARRVIGHALARQHLTVTRMVLGRQMMQNLLLEEGDITTIRSATLRKGTYVKLQPHTKVRASREHGLHAAR